MVSEITGSKLVESIATRFKIGAARENWRSTSRNAVISDSALHGRTAANHGHPRGVGAGGMLPANAKTSPAVM